MIEVQFGTIERKYTIDDIPELRRKNDYLYDEVMEMIELGVAMGNYDNSVLDDSDLIDLYMLEVINSGFVKVFNPIGERSGENMLTLSEIAEEIDIEPLRINCRTREDAKALLKMLSGEGYSWLTGESLESFTLYDTYGEYSTYAIYPNKTVVVGNDYQGKCNDVYIFEPERESEAVSQGSWVLNQSDKIMEVVEEHLSFMSNEDYYSLRRDIETMLERELEL